VIEVNLLPGGVKGAPGGGFSLKNLKMPSFKLGGGGEGGARDPYVMFFAVAAIASLGYMAWAFLGVRGEAEELQVRLEEERQDSLRFAALIAQTEELTARRDLLAQRVDLIQQIDANRYVWSHLLDEIGSAVPDYLWLREVVYTGENPLVVRIGGRAGQIFAITDFMRRLEASRFLRGATIETMQSQPSEANPDELVQVFDLTVTYESPPLEELETVPLFDTPVAAQAAAAPAGN
jgi:Tfp pilus assembly protein PilN